MRFSPGCVCCGGALPGYCICAGCPAPGQIAQVLSAEAIVAPCCFTPGHDAGFSDPSCDGTWVADFNTIIGQVCNCVIFVGGMGLFGSITCTGSGLRMILQAAKLNYPCSTEDLVVASFESIYADATPGDCDPLDVTFSGFARFGGPSAFDTWNTYCPDWADWEWRVTG